MEGRTSKIKSIYLAIIIGIVLFITLISASVWELSSSLYTNGDFELGNITSGVPFNWTSVITAGTGINISTACGGITKHGTYCVSSYPGDANKGYMYSSIFIIRGNVSVFSFEGNGVGEERAGVDIGCNDTTSIDIPFTDTNDPMNYSMIGYIGQLACIRIVDDSIGGGGWLSIDWIDTDSYFLSQIIINSPPNNYVSPLSLVDFNSSAIVVGGATLVNQTTYLYNSDGSINQTNTTTGLSGATYTGVHTFNLIEEVSYNWTGGFCDSDGDCGLSENRTISVGKIVVNSQTFNSSTYETSSENFLVNLTYDSNKYPTISADLIYNDISYSGTKIGIGNTVVFSKTLDVPIATIQTNYSFYWNVALTNSVGGIFYENSTSNNQTVNPIILQICNATYNVPYINFTFKNEDPLGDENATIDSSTWAYWLGDGLVNKTLEFTNVTENPSYAFCFSPSDKILHHSTVLQYSSDGYPQRRWVYSTDLTNSTKNQVLYLLASGDGLYSVYQVQTTTGSGIEGVSVTAERQISGTWYLVESGTTDTAGAVTFWLNPDYDHRLIFIKSGYSTIQTTLRPSSSTYTVVMSAVSGDVEYISDLEGIKWSILPALGRLDPNTEYHFEFNITASKNNLVNCKMELIDNESNVLATTSGCSTGGGNLSIDFNTLTYANLRGVYYIDIGDGYGVIDSDAYWIIMDVDIPPRGTIYAFFQHIRNLRLFGDDSGRQEFTRVILFFTILMIVMGALSYSTGWDFSTAGGCLMILFPIIAIASIAGFFTLNYTGFSSFTDKYTIALISGLVGIGYALNKLAEGRSSWENY